MGSYKISKNNSVLIIIGTLIISLLINVYSSVMNSRYKLLIGKETYNSAREIKTRNESVLSLLDQCIKAKSVTNEEMLVLYKNYTVISNEYNNLWSKYKDYGKEEIISFNKKSKTLDYSTDMPNQVYSRIETLLFEYLSLEMKNHNEKIILEENILEDFIAMNNMSQSLNDFYTDFNNTNIKDVDEEKKESIYIKNEYWVDILNGINSVVEPYLNYDYTLKK
ncbi:hypothetical protein E5347_02155 [Clostridium sartagoforme]|uniref:Reticulocyte-binding protein n=1 Tax=Clostridium sartagoforme TaxID=84031 RepID=A0A4S2DMS4_9CLOT|nr:MULTISPECIES: hypothetical protein [Clostridium]MBS5936754.1 hypothetical protein [Clostridium sp.]TGY43637.1 hypothetical protein E5347_02155 [Clostridium sartagoforme]